MGLKVRTSLTGTFQGYKQPYEFEKDGKTIPVKGKLQILFTDAEDGSIAIKEFTQPAWQAAGGPAHIDIDPGTWFTIEASIDLSSDRPWLRLENVVPAS